MYTGYYAKIKQYEAAGLITVSIAGKAPDFYTGIEYKKVAPRWAFFNEWKNGSHKGDNKYYVEHFNEEVLSKHTPEEVLNEIMGLAGVSSDKIILLCYEKPGDFCHRHLVARWLSCIVDIDEFEVK